MRQRRICEYIELSCTHLRTFLCLSQATRHQIYREAGLVDDSDLRFNEYDPNSFRLPVDDLKNCRNLLLTCHTVYAEVSEWLYSSNRFSIHYTEFEGLQILRNLRPSSIASLTYLTVHLNITSCPPGGPCFLAPVSRGLNYGFPDTPLRASSYKSRALLSEWQTTFNYMATHLKTSQLQLHLVCDVEDIETARQVVKPLMDTQLLADCAIRLAQNPDSSIQHLARDTAMRATGYLQDQSTSPFRFLDLPLELRQKILEYTNLVTPLREVQWSPENGFFLRNKTWHCGGDGGCPPELHHTCRFRNCWEWSYTGCFCCLYHAAFSSRCHCWSPPTNLFLVCRAMREHAQATFFASNRFIITPSAGRHRRATSTPVRLEASLFLLDVVPRIALYWLRLLEVVIPPFEENYFCAHEPAYQEWLRTVDYVKEELNLPSLTVCIHLAEWKPWPSGPRHFHADMTQQLGVTFLRTCRRMVDPLSKLRGLKKCFVHIAWPFDTTGQRRRVYYRNPEVQKRGIKDAERMLEQRVLGSDYDSTAMDKDDLRRSQWLEEYMSTKKYKL